MWSQTMRFEAILYCMIIPTTEGALRPELEEAPRAFTALVEIKGSSIGVNPPCLSCCRTSENTLVREGRGSISNT
ncbi:hypothetical protein QL285_064611 [Trifolium repens]|nr:hypothetical protein QL285_064611 [Trifolium repens]